MKSPLVLASDRLRISFHRSSSDRFGHTIELVDSGCAYPLLVSIEGTAEEPWPVSPPFQEAHLEQREGGRQVVLLVGMAGHSHWSGSVEIDPETESATFDIACRLRGRADWLGSRYAINPSPSRERPGEGAKSVDVIVRSTIGESGQIRLAAGPSSGPGGPKHSLLLELAATEDSAVLTLSGSEIRVSVEAAESAAAHTVRWRYVVSAVVSSP